MDHPPLPDSIRVVGDVPIERAWDMFERFEAMHHDVPIMNPLSSKGLDEVLNLMNLDHASMIDLGCGHGELLIRAAERGATGVGVDLSPWALVRAERSARQRGVADRVEWWLARAEDVVGEADRDVAAALGASWVWDGYAGTTAALAGFVRPGGTVVIGDLYRRPGVTPEHVASGFGEVPTLGEQDEALAAAGLKHVAVVDTTPQDWVDYQRSLAESAAAYLATNSGERAEEYLSDTIEWQRTNSDAPDLVGWNVRIARSD